MKILILGNDNFLGKNLTEQLKTTPEQLIPLSERDCDFRNFDQLNQSIDQIKPDLIFNCATHLGGLHYVASRPADVIHDNILMTLNLYRSVLISYPGTKIVNALANCSYPGEADIQTEDSWLSGPVHESVTAYGNAKRIAYLTSYCYRKQYGIKSINFIMPNFFGPGDETDPKRVHALSGMMIRMIQAKRNKEPRFEIWGSGKPIREWGYIKDIVRILISGMGMDELIYPVNIGQNKGYTIEESARIIAKMIGFEGVLFFNTSYQDGAYKKVLSDQEFRKLFPKFKFTDHETAIKETLEYYEKIL